MSDYLTDELTYGRLLQTMTISIPLLFQAISLRATENLSWRLNAPEPLPVFVFESSVNQSWDSPTKEFRKKVRNKSNWVELTLSNSCGSPGGDLKHRVWL